jgi:hypothetical protein
MYGLSICKHFEPVKQAVCRAGLSTVKLSESTLASLKTNFEHKMITKK